MELYLYEVRYAVGSRSGARQDGPFQTSTDRHYTTQVRAMTPFQAERMVIESNGGSARCQIDYSRKITG